MNPTRIDEIRKKAKQGDPLTSQELRLFHLARMVEKYVNGPVEREIIEALAYLVENTPEVKG